MTFSLADPWPLAVLFFATAVLYAAVGNAGASGYLAAMTLAGLAPETMQATALTLHLVVALITTLRFSRAGYFSWSLFWPLTVASMPFAFLGGALALPSALYRGLVGLVLLCAAYRLFWYTDQGRPRPRAVPLGPALCLGAGLGLVSRLTGVGGGIFLSPSSSGWGGLSLAAVPVSRQPLFSRGLSGAAVRHDQGQACPRRGPPGPGLHRGRDRAGVGGRTVFRYRAAQSP